MNVVRRRGDVVHRPTSAATPAIHRLLRHVRDQGFRRAPEPRGFDADGNELLTFLDGEVPGGPGGATRTTSPPRSTGCPTPTDR
ncbi:hypothetical protein ACIF6L_37050 [Kitasatospora sp. NPDC086009]|uniref:hypothetical protein n=1 Tax=unclassified Kitasatospora TaxID=2633591 RepID=UPI0037CAD51E